MARELLSAARIVLCNYEKQPLCDQNLARAHTREAMKKGSEIEKIQVYHAHFQNAPQEMERNGEEILVLGDEYSRHDQIISFLAPN